MTRCTFCDTRNPPGAKQCRSCGAELRVDSAETDAAEASDYLEEALHALLRNGQKIEAVKLYRERTGVGLAEAKEAVEALLRGEEITPPVRQTSEPSEQDVLELLRAGKKIDAIKLYREQTGSGLAEAKQAVEQLGREHGIESRSGCAGVLLACALIACAIAGLLT